MDGWVSVLRSKQKHMHIHILTESAFIYAHKYDVVEMGIIVDVR